jgi:hypothetical protein
MVIITIEKFLSLSEDQIKEYSWSKKITPKGNIASTSPARPVEPTRIFVTPPPPAVAVAASNSTPFVFNTAAAATRSPALVQRARRPPPGPQGLVPSAQPRSVAQSLAPFDAHHHQKQARVQARAQSRQPVSTLSNLTNLQQAPAPAPVPVPVSVAVSSAAPVPARAPTPIQTQAPAPAALAYARPARNSEPKTSDILSSHVLSSHLPTDPGDFITYAVQQNFPMGVIANALKAGYPSLLGQLSRADVEAAIRAQTESTETGMEL